MKTVDFAAIIWLCLVFAIGYGWVMNIINIVHADFTHITGLLVIQVVGIFVAPLGSVLGWVM